MKVTLLQMDIACSDIAQNCNAAAALMAAQPGSDLYVLPEMWSTGFITDPTFAAEEENQSAALAWMKEMSHRVDAAIAGSVAIHAEDGSCRNRLYFVKPDGEVAHYDKRHLFTYAGEQRHYTAGRERVIVAWRGVRFLLQVCYDLRFPCFARNRGDYDCALYVASWPASRMAPWHVLLRARAIENQCYVLGVNRIGNDASCAYCGGTACIDAYGNPLAACADHEASAITVALDMSALEAFRKKFPVLGDADNASVISW